MAVDAAKTEAMATAVSMQVVEAINSLSVLAEDRLAMVNMKTSQLETKLKLLEFQLDSIEGLDFAAAEKPKSNDEHSSKDEERSHTSAAPVSSGVEEEVLQYDAPVVEDSNANILTNCQHPSLQRFFKMLNMGVPMPAVQHKMTMEGFDGSLLEKPDDPFVE